MKELANVVPRERHRAKTYYHGSSKADLGEQILKDGFLRPPVLSKVVSSLTPRPGKVYFTSSMKMVLPYVLGGNVAGIKMEIDPGKGRFGRWGYLFEIDGQDLVDIEPDEDEIGEMIHDDNPIWLRLLAEPILRQYNISHPDLPEDLEEDLRLNPELWSDVYDMVVDGAVYSAFAFAGKVMVPFLDDDDIYALLNRGLNVAHHGPIPVRRAWRFDKTKCKQLKRDGSNFFELAEEVKMNPAKGEQIYREVMEKGRRFEAPQFSAGRQKIQRILHVPSLKPYGKGAGRIINQVHKSGRKNFSVAKAPEGGWDLIAWTWERPNPRNQEEEILDELISSYPGDEELASYAIDQYDVVDQQVPAEMRDLVNSVLKDFTENLLPLMNEKYGWGPSVFETLTVFYGEIGGGDLARHIDGGREHILIVLDLDAVKRGSDEYGVPLVTAIETSILHELGHAIQEQMDLEKGEEEAEEFARNWFYDRELIDFGTTFTSPPASEGDPQPNPPLMGNSVMFDPEKIEGMKISGYTYEDEGKKFLRIENIPEKWAKDYWMFREPIKKKKAPKSGFPIRRAEAYSQIQALPGGATIWKTGVSPGKFVAINEHEDGIYLIGMWDGKRGWYAGLPRWATATQGWGIDMMSLLDWTQGVAFVDQYLTRIEEEEEEEEVVEIKAPATKRLFDFNPAEDMATARALARRIVSENLMEDLFINPENPPTMPIKEFTKHCLFHGTGEPIIGHLRPGGWDGVFWTATDPSIAQTYIPHGTGLSTYATFDYWVKRALLRDDDPEQLPYLLEELDKMPRPDKHDFWTEVLEQMGYDTSDVEYDDIGRAKSWPIDKKFTWRSIVAFLDNLGYDVENTLRKEGHIELYSIIRNRKHHIMPKEDQPGKLFVLFGKENLKIFDGQRCGLSYNDLQAFKEINKAGYDAVLIEDLAQTKYWGSFIHDSIGLFPRGLEKMKAFWIEARNFDGENIGKGTTPEYEDWYNSLDQEAIEDLLSGEIQIGPINVVANPPLSLEEVYKGEEVTYVEGSGWEVFKCGEYAVKIRRKWSRFTPGGYYNWNRIPPSAERVVQISRELPDWVPETWLVHREGKNDVILQRWIEGTNPSDDDLYSIKKEIRERGFLPIDLNSYNAMQELYPPYKIWVFDVDGFKYPSEVGKTGMPVKEVVPLDAILTEAQAREMVGPENWIDQLEVEVEENPRVSIYKGMFAQEIRDMILKEGPMSIAKIISKYHGRKRAPTTNQLDNLMPKSGLFEKVGTTKIKGRGGEGGGGSYLVPVWDVKEEIKALAPKKEKRGGRKKERNWTTKAPFVIKSDDRKIGVSDPYFANLKEGEEIPVWVKKKRVGQVMATKKVGNVIHLPMKDLEALGWKKGMTFKLDLPLENITLVESLAATALGSALGASAAYWLTKHLEKNPEPLHMVSWSGGKDSTAMLLRMLELGLPVDLVVFADTGNEFPEMYEFIKYFDEWLFVNHGLHVTVARYSDDPHKSFLDWFYGQITRGKLKGHQRGMPLVLSGCWWQRESKVKAMAPYNEGNFVYIGIASNEAGRAGEYEGVQAGYRYPLIEWGWTEQDVIDYLKETGWFEKNPLFGRFWRTGCWFCPKQSKTSIYTLYRYYPELFQKLKELDKASYKWDETKGRYVGGFTTEPGKLDKWEREFRTGRPQLRPKKQLPRGRQTRQTILK